MFGLLHPQLGQRPTSGLSLAEPTVVTGGHITFPLERHGRTGLQLFLPPFQQVRGFQFELRYIIDTRLVDGHPNSINSIEVTKHIQRPECVQHHLLIIDSRDTHSLTVFKVNNLKSTIRNNDGITGTECFRCITGQVYLLFYPDNGITGSMTRGQILFVHKVSVVFSIPLHIRLIKLLTS